MVEGRLFTKMWEFVCDAGRWGMTSTLAALVAFVSSIYEHVQGKAIPAYVLIAISVPLFWFGAYMAWSKKRHELEEERAKDGRADLFPTQKERNALLAYIRSKQTVSLGVFSFLTYPKTTDLADQLVSAFTEGGWSVTRGQKTAESQPFIAAKKGVYGKGIWIVGPDSKTVAAALQEAGIGNTHIDHESDMVTTAIVVGELQ